MCCLCRNLRIAGSINTGLPGFNMKTNCLSGQGCCGQPGVLIWAKGDRSVGLHPSAPHLLRGLVLRLAGQTSRNQAGGPTGQGCGTEGGGPDRAAGHPLCCHAPACKSRTALAVTTCSQGGRRWLMHRQSAADRLEQGTPQYALPVHVQGITHREVQPTLLTAPTSR
jgi:hypothetical protein